MKVCFFTLAVGEPFKTYAGWLVKSARKFHPDIPFIVFDKNKLNEATKEFPSLFNKACAGYIGSELIRKYDAVVKFDADQIVVDSLDELLKFNYELASVRNNNKFNMAGCIKPLVLHMRDTQNYVNSGIVSSSSIEFWDEYFEMTKRAVRKFLWNEQDILNIIFHTGKFKTRILDAIGTNVCYGMSNCYGKKTHWDSWKDIHCVSNKLWLDDMKIKIIHLAGGPGKLDFNIKNLFQHDVADYINKIIGG